MTVKARGIRLKTHLSPEDQGQRKLMQATYAQLAASHSEAMGPTAVGHPPASVRPRPLAVAAKRRAIARMLRIELEATLAFLDQALDDMAGSDALTGSGHPGK